MSTLIPPIDIPQIMELKLHDHEIVLHKLWKSKKLFGASLQTLSGADVEVIYGGTENLDAGPDFKEAVIKVAGKLIKGDIEIHLDPSGWYAHGHHEDPRYNGVILHLISEHGDQETIERQDGVRVPQLLVDADAAKIELWKKSTKSLQIPINIVENCPLRQQEATKISRIIQVAGGLRLEQKADQLREQLVALSWDQLIYQKMLEALGYAKNQAAFAKLAELLPFSVLQAEMQWRPEAAVHQHIAALLFGAAGLLPSQANSQELGADADVMSYVGPLEDLWHQASHRLELTSMKPHAWQFFRLRPQNFPTRRLAGLVELIRRFGREGLLANFVRVFSGNSSDYRKIANALEASLTVTADGFWKDNYNFETASGRSASARGALIGKDRARDIAVNTILPALLLYSIQTQDGQLRNAVREIFMRHPKLAENSITKAMRKQLFDHDATTYRGIVNAASQQQGLIMLHKSFCRPLKCGECLGLAG